MATNYMTHENHRYFHLHSVQISYRVTLGHGAEFSLCSDKGPRRKENFVGLGSSGAFPIGLKIDRQQAATLLREARKLHRLIRAQG